MAGWCWESRVEDHKLSTIWRTKASIISKSTNFQFLGGGSGLVVMGEDSCSKGREFESQYGIQDGCLLYHRLTHQKHRMFNMCVEVVETRKRSSPASDTTKILNELLANDAWLEQVRLLRHWCLWFSDFLAIDLSVGNFWPSHLYVYLLVLQLYKYNAKLT